MKDIICGLCREQLNIARGNHGAETKSELKKEWPTLPMMSTAASSSSTSVPVLAVIFPQPPPELAISPVPEAVECEQCDVGANAFCCYCYSALCLQCFETHHCGMTKLTSSFDGRCIECRNQADKRCLRCVHPVS